MTETGLYFSRDELLEIPKQKLQNIADYLGITISRQETKSTLIEKIMEKQKELIPDLFGPPGSEEKKYSVRIQRIMDAKARGEQI